jgi:hypothetical protein
MRYFDYLRPIVVKELSHARSKIHRSFDRWTTKGSKRGFLGIVAYYVTGDSKLRDLPIALPQLTGAYSSERMAVVVLEILQKFDINTRKVGYFVLNNASNNNSTILAILLKPGWSFNAIHRRLCCFPHTLNLIRQLLLRGKDADAFNSDSATSNLTKETQFIRD